MNQLVTRNAVGDACLILVLEPGNIHKIKEGRPITKHIEDFFPEGLIPRKLELLIYYSDTPVADSKQFEKMAKMSFDEREAENKKRRPHCPECKSTIEQFGVMKNDSSVLLMFCPECGCVLGALPESILPTQAKDKGEPEKPKYAVGVSVLVTNAAGELLLGKRKNCNAAGLLSTPGGRIEMKETSLDCAMRELREETGLEIDSASVRLIGYKEHFRYGEHYFMTYVHVSYGLAEAEPEPKNLEPDKCEGWQWYPIRDIVVGDCTEPPEILESLLKKEEAEHAQ